MTFVVGGVVAAVLILAGAWYYLSFPSSPPAPRNTPPHELGILMSPSAGDNRTMFTFAAQVTDDQEPISAIQVRWDWENDSVWDTNWSTNKITTHQFFQPADYTVRLEARDSGNLTANVTRPVTVASPPQPLRIGTVLSLTGALALIGGSQQSAVGMAVDEINAAGGALGMPVQLFSQDDHTDPGTAASAASTLISQDHVDALIGATGAAMCAAVLPIAKAHGVLEIAPSCTLPEFSNLTWTDGWFARTVPSDALQAVVAAHYAYSNLSIRYAAVIGDAISGNTYGMDVANAFADNFTKFGGTITSGSPRIVPGNQPDYLTDIQAILNVSPAPQLVYVAAYPPDAWKLTEDWYGARTTHPSWAGIHWAFSDTAYDPGVINTLVGAGVNVTGFWGTAPAAYAGMEPPEYAGWAAQYTAKYGAPPALFAANAYDATYIVALAAQAAGNTSGASVKASLRAVANPPGVKIYPGEWAKGALSLLNGHDVDYEGASGSVNLNAYGDAPSAYVIWAVNSSDQFYVEAFFSENLVVSFLPVGFFPQVARIGALSVASVRPRFAAR